MANEQKFSEAISAGYTSSGATITLGAGMLNGKAVREAQVKIPLKTLNRHGLIAGATGTGKTVTLQMIAENMCQEGIPVLLMDLKGDLSGIAKAGSENPKIKERHDAIGIQYVPLATATEFLTLSKEPGARLRATVSEFGPVLFSKILELNDAQSGLVAILFKYADDKNLLLLDLKDFKALLQFAGGDGKAELQKEYGNISPASLSTVLRKIVELEGQGADVFFGEKSFDVNDLLAKDTNGKGIASIIRLSDMQDRPKLFSTFMLCLLAELYATLPESGDMDRPKLCIFIDEAHLIFKNSSKALLDQIESIVKLIRSKGVGIYFITQNPEDVPDGVLAQLGLKVQHALRAFTEKDRKAIRKTAENYPISEFYETDTLLTSLGIGEALITGLNEKGIPTPLAAVRLKAPGSRIGVLQADELQAVLSTSKLSAKYNQVIDRESAYEILNNKLVQEQEKELEETEDAPKPKAARVKEEKSILERASENTLVRQAGRTVVRELARGLLGVLGLGGGSSKRKKTGWF